MTDAAGTTAAPTYTFPATASVAYSVWDVVADGAGNVTVAVNSSIHFSVTGFAFDNGISEPATMALLGLGGLGLLRRRRHA